MVIKIWPSSKFAIRFPNHKIITSADLLFLITMLCSTLRLKLCRISDVWHYMSNRSLTHWEPEWARGHNLGANMNMWILICQLHLLTTFFEWPQIYISLNICLVYVIISTRLSMSLQQQSTTDHISSTACSHNITILITKVLKISFSKNVLIRSVISASTSEYFSKYLFLLLSTDVLFIYQTLLLWNMRKYIMCRRCLKLTTCTNSTTSFWLWFSHQTNC